YTIVPWSSGPTSLAKSNGDISIFEGTPDESVAATGSSTSTTQVVVMGEAKVGRFKELCVYANLAFRKIYYPILWPRVSSKFTWYRKGILEDLNNSFFRSSVVFFGSCLGLEEGRLLHLGMSFSCDLRNRLKSKSPNDVVQDRLFISLVMHCLTGTEYVDR
nr:hypothetical protein [Tanacetum cinerariifolium]